MWDFRSVDVTYFRFEAYGDCAGDCGGDGGGGCFSLWIGGGDLTNVVILHHLLAEYGNWPLLAVLCSIAIMHAHCLLAKHCIYQE